MKVTALETHHKQPSVVRGRVTNKSKVSYLTFLSIIDSLGVHARDDTNEPILEP